MLYVRLTCSLLFAGFAGYATAVELRPLEPRTDQIARTNDFMQATFALHERIVARHETRTEESTGGYKGYPDFYREVRFYDEKSGRLLSKLQWERARPERLHAIEVYVYDHEGRVARDYSGWFLPRGRNAPRDTWITLHAYNNGLHALRQFDALDNRVYESCEGTFQGARVELSRWEMEIAGAAASGRDVTKTGVYEKCFAGLPVTSAGEYLTPQ